MNAAAGRGSRPYGLDDKVAALRVPLSYPGGIRRVEAIETHFAWVFLAGRHAYKLKKPVRQAAMDYRSLAAREHGCREELRLNRRFAPQVYLGVVPLTVQGGSLVVGRGGAVVDWLVKMRRLPASGMLDRRLLRRALRRDELDRLCTRLAGFFARAESVPFGEETYIARLRREVLQNRRTLRGARAHGCRALADSAADTQREFITRARHLLEGRAGRVVEGHGDLRAEHVHLGPPVCVIDCLEFSRELRLLDPVEELAFLSLEVERLGWPRLAAEIPRRVCALRGDSVPEAVVSFYTSHRASTRAKLALWHVGDPQFPDARPWIARARSYLEDAHRHAQLAVRLLERDASAAVGGRPAVEQRRERLAGQHAPDRFREQWSDAEDAQSVLR
jgi:aminoglycoside phosphotransferase family enzyme